MLSGGDPEVVRLAAVALLIEEGVENAESRLEGIRDAEGVIAGFRCFWAGEILLHRFAEERDPTLKMGLADGEDSMFWERFPAVGHGAKEKRAPEFIHGREVMVPIHFGEIIENRAQNFVLIHLLVKGIDKGFDVLL